MKLMAKKIINNSQKNKIIILKDNKVKIITIINFKKY